VSSLWKVLEVVMAEIKFPRSFETGNEFSLPIGRMYVGGHVMRLMFTTEGRVVAAITKEAVDDGSLVLLPVVEPLMEFEK